MSSSVTADVAILGAGTAGCLVARNVLASTAADVLLIEAGPDYGSRDDGRWPADLLDSVTLPTTHDWGYRGPAATAGITWQFERAKVLGGCSAHNGCSQTVGWAGDYDEWGLGWTRAEVAARFEAVQDALHVRHYDDDELTPYQTAVLDALVECGIARTDDLDDLDGGIGCGPSPVNNLGGVRWNAAFAFLDGVRHLERLNIIDQAIVMQLDIAAGSIRRAVIGTDRGQVAVHARHFILCAGAYGTPEILLRSGVGPPDELGAVGVPCVVDLPGVGRNLHDHPAIELRFEASARLERQMSEFAEKRPAPDEQVIAKADSLVGDGPYDMHVFPWTERAPNGRLECVLPAAALRPVSRGSVTLRSPNMAVPAVIDHGYLTDHDGHDREVLRQGLELTKAMSVSRSLAPMLGAVVEDSMAPNGYRFAHYWHPAGSCTLGASPDDGAVVDPSGQVFGLENLHIIDASTMPFVPRATTNLPVLVLADLLSERVIAAMDQPSSGAPIR